MNDLGKEILTNAKVTLVFTGYGFLSITEKAVVWNKTATSYLAFGLMAAATDNHLFLPLEKIAKVETYTYFPGGGLILTTNEGRTYKIAFKKKKDFIVAHTFLSEICK